MQRSIRIFFIGLILLQSGCGATVRPGIRNFEHRDNCDLKHQYVWLDLEWKLK